MIKEIIIVDSITESLNYWGIEYFNNKILQEQSGGYFFIDMSEECGQVKRTRKKQEKCEDCEICILECSINGISGSPTCPKGYLSRPKMDCGGCILCIHPLPLKIAYFILQAMRLQRNAFSLTIPPSNDGIEEILGSYLGVDNE